MGDPDRNGYLSGMDGCCPGLHTTRCFSHHLSPHLFCPSALPNLYLSYLTRLLARI